MILCGGAYIDEGQSQLVCHQGSPRDSTRGNASHHLSLGIEVAHLEGKGLLDIATMLGIGERLAVVTIDGAKPTRSPGKGGIWTKLDSLYSEQAMSYRLGDRELLN